MILVVGGQTKNAGKTRVMCSIIRATSAAQWTAVKISRHGHGADLTRPLIEEETQPGPRTDTGRYLEAGAARAFWIRAAHEHTAEALAGLESRNMIIESTSVLDTVVPDLFVFVEQPPNPDWKDSAVRHASRADFRVSGDLTPGLIPAVLARLKAQL